MNKEPTEAQRKEFWKHYLTWEKCNLKSPCETGHFITPDGKVFYGELPDIDPNNLLRYAVPEYIKQVGLEHNWDEKGIIHHLFRAWLRCYEKGKGVLSFEDALFWALWPVREAVK